MLHARTLPAYFVHSDLLCVKDRDLGLHYFLCMSVRASNEIRVYDPYCFGGDSFVKPLISLFSGCVQRSIGNESVFIKMSNASLTLVYRFAGVWKQLETQRYCNIYSVKPQKKIDPKQLFYSNIGLWVLLFSLCIKSFARANEADSDRKFHKITKK